MPHIFCGTPIVRDLLYAYFGFFHKTLRFNQLVFCTSVGMNVAGSRIVFLFRSQSLDYIQNKAEL